MTCEWNETKRNETKKTFSQNAKKTMKNNVDGRVVADGNKCARWKEKRLEECPKIAYDTCFESQQPQDKRTVPCHFALIFYRKRTYTTFAWQTEDCSLYWWSCIVSHHHHHHIQTQLTLSLQVFDYFYRPSVYDACALNALWHNGKSQCDKRGWTRLAIHCHIG